MGPCLAAAGAPSAGGPDPGGTSQPNSGSTVDCELDTPPEQSVGWVIENEGVLDYQVLGHSPGINIGGAADPRVVQLDDGRYRMYFGQPREYGTGAAISTDGINWSVEAPMVLRRGLPHVTLLRLEDGSWRLFAVDAENFPAVVLSFISDDGIEFTQEEGYRLTEQDFPFGDIGTPFVIRQAEGGYRMYLTAVPEGETAGGAGGNSKTWVVSATSTDMLAWDVDPLVMIEDPDGQDWTGMDNMHPWVGVNEDGLFEMYSGLAGPATKRVSVDGRVFSDPEYLPVFGSDYHVERLADGEIRLYVGSGTPDTGGDIDILRSSDVWWDVEFAVRRMWGDTDDPDSVVLSMEVCVKGSSSTPVEIQLFTGAGPFATGERDQELEMSALSVRSEYPPFQSTLTLPRGEDSREFPGGTGMESLLRVSDGIAMKEWKLMGLTQRLRTG